MALFIWLTPHTVLMSAGEVKAMGGAQHPVVGNYGVMSAKNGAVNVMILFDRPELSCIIVAQIER